MKEEFSLMTISILFASMLFIGFSNDVEAAIYLKYKLDRVFEFTQTNSNARVMTSYN